jgi:phosphoesterase RecJ-like protein
VKSISLKTASIRRRRIDSGLTPPFESSKSSIEIPLLLMSHSESFAAILSLIEKSESVLVLSHDRPDGDAIGSMVAFGLILESVGKRVEMVNFNEVPESLAFLPRSERVERPGKRFDGDLVIVLDSAGKDRINEAVWNILPPNTPMIVIDHHISNVGFGDLCLVDSDSPATGQILFQFFEFAGWMISPEVASHLYAAISTDTGSFRYPSTTAETMRIGGELLRFGVDVGWINQMLYENQPRRRVEVLRRLLEGLRYDFEDRCVSVSLPLRLTSELGLQPGDTEGVIDILRSVDSVIIAVFFEELPGGKIRVSSRSKEPRYGVGDICAQFGGGGHTLAAGARLKGPLPEARERFLDEVGKSLTRN